MTSFGDHFPAPKSKLQRNRWARSKIIKDQTLIPWQKGKCVAWDVTVADTFATSYINHTVTLAGAAAERAALNKHAKYEHFKNNYNFIPLACEKMGAWSADSIAFFDGLAEKIHSITGDKRVREINYRLPETFYCDPKRKCCLHSMLFF